MRYEKAIKEYQFIIERILIVPVKIESTCLHIFSVYAPEDYKSEEEKQNFSEIPDRHLNDIPVKEEVLITGGVNATVGKVAIPGIRQRSKEDTGNSNGSYLYMSVLTMGFESITLFLTTKSNANLLSRIQEVTNQLQTT